MNLSDFDPNIFVYPTQLRNSEEFVITTSAPTSKYFTTSATLSMPVLAAGGPLIFPAKTPI